MLFIGSYLFILNHVKHFQNTIQNATFLYSDYLDLVYTAPV